MTHRVYCQQWEESERGWGVRPDGYSLHLTLTDHKKFIEDYWLRMPDQAPDEYSRPSGQPQAIEVDTATYKQIQDSKLGIWASTLPKARE